MEFSEAQARRTLTYRIGRRNEWAMAKVAATRAVLAHGDSDTLDKQRVLDALDDIGRDLDSTRELIEQKIQEE